MFQGVYTAIVTPFTASGEVDEFALQALIRDQVEAGVDRIVPVGTTGESPTLEVDEHIHVIRTAIEHAGSRLQIIAGTGANSTAEAIELTAAARDLGAHGTLQVTPYYNKPSDAGLVRHLEAIADLGLPVMLYNVPGRSAKSLALDVVDTLAQHPHIVAIKEAAGDVARVTQIIDRCGTDIAVFSGDDPLTFPMMALGARGVVSVASNVIPRIVREKVHFALDGQWDAARELHQHWYRFFSGMFLETNPIPVKTTLALMGKIEERFRLPLCPLTETPRAELETLLRDYNLI